MQTRKVSSHLAGIVAVLALVSLFIASRAAAQTESVLHSFNNSTNLKGGMQPESSLVMDSAGNLYGTTTLGGTNCASQDGCGTVFQLVPKSGGGWTENVIHNFNNNGKDGMTPVAGVIFDSAGNLYGTTVAGGIYGQGAVFELSPKLGGGWTERLLHSFNNNGKDGTAPYGSLVFDSVGNLYGTTSKGGLYNNGTAFRMSPKTGGGFTEVVLHNFIANNKDGKVPMSNLIFDSAGNLYGTTYYGGVYGDGTVFELSPPASGNQWTETVIYSFPNITDGFADYGLIIDSAGNLYGTTVGLTTSTYGTVFELSPTTGGTWTTQVLHTFCSETGCADGTVPVGSLIFDSSGNLYGVTRSGGPGKNPQGTVFELTPAGGSWTLTTLHTFGQTKTDGAMPMDGVIMDGAGHLYGTTYEGGFSSGGSVYEVTP
jgi:uncharacterized repeat protein (TIGR03803 family)